MKGPPALCAVKMFSGATGDDTVSIGVLSSVAGAEDSVFNVPYASLKLKVLKEVLPT
jgi:hypothetical protein